MTLNIVLHNQHVHLINKRSIINWYIDVVINCPRSYVDFNKKA